MKGCRCGACLGLLAECGPELFEQYRKKLLMKGWAGVLSPAEKAYRLAHSSDAQSRAERLRQRQAQGHSLHRNRPSVSVVSGVRNESR